MNSKTKATIVEITAALFIFLFVYTAISKFLEHEKFVLTLHQSPLLSGYSSTLSLIIPSTEILISGLLIIPQLRKTGLWSGLSLMTLFTGYIIYMLASTPHLPCSCGGIIQELSWQQHLVVNLFFIALSIVSVALTRKTTTIG